MRVAVVGCCHGELKLMYKRIKEMSDHVDLVLVTGDFQAVRSESDLESMSVPAKYRRFGDFRDFFDGRERAPFLTLFIGGNHESSNFLRELYHGGWVCPNIYYLGSAGIVRFCGLRIAGVSGIYSQRDYMEGYNETLPIRNERDKKKATHYRDFEFFRLKLLAQPVDIFLSHDWPRNIWEYGNKAEFLRKKPFLRSEIERGEFGSPPLECLLDTLAPRFWFSSHMHCRFQAQYNDTLFLALDKCVRGRDYVDILEIGSSPKSEPMLQYDPEWIGILSATSHLIPHGSYVTPNYSAPSSGKLGDGSDLTIPHLSSSDGLRAVKAHYEGFMDKFSLSDPFK